jgi:hypothetical protein
MHMLAKDQPLSAQSDAAKAYLPLITNGKGLIRASKPKDGNAAYVWRMVAFSVSTDRRQQCMPMTADFGVTVPEDWRVNAPADWIEARVASTYERPDDVAFCQRQNGSVRAYHVAQWEKYDRRRAYIKDVLDPIVKEIVDSVHVTKQAGTMRWARAFGVA